MTEHRHFLAGRLLALALMLGGAAMLGACALGTPANTEGRRTLPVGTVWYWLGDADLISARIVRTPAQYNLSLEKKDRARVQADCNRGTATVDSTEEGRMWVERFAMTRALCPAGSLSDRFVDTLERAAVSDVRGNVMRIEQQQFGAFSYFALDATASVSLYRCASSETLAAVRIGDELKVWVGDELFVLQRDAAAGADRFSAGDMAWQVRGNAASLTREGIPLHTDCRASARVEG